MAFIAEPGILFLDKPTLGLDSLRRELWSILCFLRGSVTVILTKHYLEEAEQLDHIAILSEGRLAASGTPAKLIQLSGEDNFEEAFIIFFHKHP